MLHNLNVLEFYFDVIGQHGPTWAEHVVANELIYAIIFFFLINYRAYDSLENLLTLRYVI